MTDLPGPGNYEDTNTFGKSGQKVGIQGKRADEKDKGVPGPGAYDKKDGLTKSTSVMFKIGSSGRGDIIDKNVSDLPGPGNYSETITFGKGGI